MPGRKSGGHTTPSRMRPAAPSPFANQPRTATANANIASRETEKTKPILSQSSSRTMSPFPVTPEIIGSPVLKMKTNGGIAPRALAAAA